MSCIVYKKALTCHVKSVYSGYVHPHVAAQTCHSRPRAVDDITGRGEGAMRETVMTVMWWKIKMDDFGYDSSI